MRTQCLAVIALSALACSETTGAPAAPTAPTEAAPSANGPPLESPDGRAEPSCLPEFRTQGGWLAADGARSIPLSDGRTVHLFGDTLIGPTDESDERARTMVGNTIGISRCEGDDWSIQYFWRDDGTHRTAIFTIPGEHVWPSEGFVLGGRLHVILSKIIHVDYGLKFDYAGSVLATVENVEAPPNEWDVTYRTLSTSRQYRPTKGVTVVGDVAYVFTELPFGEYPHPALLLRLPETGLEAPEDALEYLAADRTWKPIAGWSQEDAYVVAQKVGPTMYVHRHDGLGKWLTFGVDPDNRRHLIMETADALEGPWTRGPMVHRFEEIPDALPDGGQVHIACYAVTEHPQMRRNGGRTVVLTYSCNRTRGFDFHTVDLDLYLPRTLTVDLPSP